MHCIIRPVPSRNEFGDIHTQDSSELLSGKNLGATTLVLVRAEWLRAASETKRTLAVSITLSLAMFLLLLLSTYALRSISLGKKDKTNISCVNNPFSGVEEYFVD